MDDVNWEPSCCESTDGSTISAKVSLPFPSLMMVQLVPQTLQLSLKPFKSKKAHCSEPDCSLTHFLVMVKVSLPMQTWGFSIGENWLMASAEEEIWKLEQEIAFIQGSWFVRCTIAIRLLKEQTKPVAAYNLLHYVSIAQTIIKCLEVGLWAVLNLSQRFLHFHYHSLVQQRQR